LGGSVHLVGGIRAIGVMSMIGRATTQCLNSKSCWAMEVKGRVPFRT
jgi:hypothetical protein